VKIPRAVRATQTLACVLIPDFGIHVLRQQQPELMDAPVALVRYGKVKGKIIAVSKEAEQLGITSGLAISRARALAPTGHFITHESDGHEKAIQALLERLWVFTNRIEIELTALPQTLVAYLDFGRMTEEERDLVFDGVTMQLADAHYPATVAFATGKLPAYIAATRGVDEVPVGEEATFIADVPIEVLSLPKELHQQLDDVLIHTLGDLAVQPRAAVAGQLGREGIRLYQLANGIDGRPVKPRQMPAVEQISHDPDTLLTTRAQIDKVIKDLSHTLAERLDKRGAALHEIALILHFPGGRQRTERLHLLQSVSSAESLNTTLLQLIDRRTLTQAITRLDVRLAHLVSAMPRQLELFTDKPQRQSLLELAEVLSKRYGHCFYQGALADTQSLLPEERFRAYRVTS
jgi:nucleotidyltransferase/DNA polymerase involved in DNA repair